MVEETIAGLPAMFRDRLADVAVVVRRKPGPDDMREAGVPRGESLFGVYCEDPPARIVIFKKPLEESCADGGELVREIRKTIIHEVGHRLGMKEEDLERLGME